MLTIAVIKLCHLFQQDQNGFRDAGDTPVQPIVLQAVEEVLRLPVVPTILLRLIEQRIPRESTTPSALHCSDAGSKCASMNSIASRNCNLRTHPLRLTAMTDAGKRRLHPGGKRGLVDARMQPTASIAGSALKACVNGNRLRKWIRPVSGKRYYGGLRERTG